MAEVNEMAVESALEAAFGNAPKEAPAPAEEAPAAEEAAVEEAPAVEEVPEAEAAPESLLAEPEFEIEVDGAREVVKGADAIKELLQKGRDYSKKTELVARARDAVQAEWEQFQASQQFQAAVFDDVTELRALDSQLEQYNKIDWAAAFDSDPFNAMKLKEQRDQLRENRSAKLNQLQSKQQQFQQARDEAARKMLAAESAALLAKVPEWRASETRTKEQQEIRATLAAAGFNEAEINGVRDHRQLIIARKAAILDRLMANKAQKVGQVRSAPPVVKPGAQQDKGKVEARSELKQFNEAGRKGNHRTQEQLLEKMLTRAFK